MERIPDVSRRIATHKEVEWEELPDGRIAIHRKKLGPLRRKMLKALGLADELTVRLDALGSAAWLLMDGTRTVGEIHRSLAMQFPQDDDMGPRLGRYLSIMVSHGLVKFK